MTSGLSSQLQPLDSKPTGRFLQPNNQDVDSLGTHFASVRFKHTTFRLSSPKHQIRWNSSSTLKLQLRSGFSQYRLVEEECNKDGFLNGSDQAIDFATQLIRCRNWQGLRAIMTEKCLEVCKLDF
ncbi:hypothetical protein QR680_002893 [Steinernema hermaphroditum]|uniref:Uncharacterized protein n=1 Tax=Steinernema hermaphroditum TaxID=289476 RepID=A0AA39H5F4_9BILA|nr:hypothetical protein QR680_002893 [Steinernema hermaphroditum]